MKKTALIYCISMICLLISCNTSETQSVDERRIESFNSKRINITIRNRITDISNDYRFLDSTQIKKRRIITNADCNGRIDCIKKADKNGYDKGKTKVPSTEWQDNYYANSSQDAPPVTPFIYGGIYAAYASLKEVVHAIQNGNIEMTHINNIWEYRDYIYPNVIFYPITYNVLDNNYIGVDCGYFHNQLILEAISNQNYENWTDEDIAYHILLSFEQIYSIQISEIGMSETGTLFNELDEEDVDISSFQEEFDIINLCENVLEEISSRYWASYINDVAAVVDSMAQVYPEYVESALLINGSLSVLYHSYRLWNTVVPDPNMFVPWYYLPSEGIIETLEVSNWQSQLDNMMVEHSELVQIIPQTHDGLIDRLFIFRENNENTFDDFVNGTISNNSYPIYTTTNHELVVSLETQITNSLFIPYGTYQIDISPDNNACAITISY